MFVGERPGLRHDHTAPGAAVAFNYDPMNRLAKTAATLGASVFEVENTYDLNGTLVAIDYPGELWAMVRDQK